MDAKMRARIRALESGAGSAGDTEMVAICRRALEGPGTWDGSQIEGLPLSPIARRYVLRMTREAAVSACERVMSANEAMNDEKDGAK